MRARDKKFTFTSRATRTGRSGSYSSSVGVSLGQSAAAAAKHSPAKERTVSLKPPKPVTSMDSPVSSRRKILSGKEARLEPRFPNPNPDEEDYYANGKYNYSLPDDLDFNTVSDFRRQQPVKSQELEIPCAADILDSPRQRSASSVTANSATSIRKISLIPPGMTAPLSATYTSRENATSSLFSKNYRTAPTEPTNPPSISSPRFRPRDSYFDQRSSSESLQQVKDTVSDNNTTASVKKDDADLMKELQRKLSELVDLSTNMEMKDLKVQEKEQEEISSENSAKCAGPDALANNSSDQDTSIYNQQSENSEEDEEECYKKLMAKFLLNPSLRGQCLGSVKVPLNDKKKTITIQIHEVQFPSFLII